MKKLLIGLLALGSVSAFADSNKLCQIAYDNHYERLNLISDLNKAGELSDEEVKLRIEDSEAIFEISKAVMCKGISKSTQSLMQAEAIYNASK